MRSLVLFAFFAGAVHSVSAQEAVLQGRVVSALTGDPIAGATVVVEETRQQTVAAADGTFQFDKLAPGEYHLAVRTSGFSSRRTEVIVAVAGPPVELRIDPDLHFQDVTSVSADTRSQFETYQPTSVLAGQELTKQLERSLGATLEQLPGIAVRSFGPSPSRPVVRGLDGDRVLILQDGQRTGDLSSQSGDHGVAINPASAERIEVVRGPATLLYGANAIGGLVNVITSDVPTAPVRGASGDVVFDLASAADEGGGSARVQLGNGRLAATLAGGGRRASDFTTPEGRIDNSHSRNGFATVGLAWTGDRAHFGGSYGYDDTKYGIPVVEEGSLQLTPRRHALTVRGGASQLNGFFESFRASLARRQYTHEELEGDEIGTRFDNDTTEVQLLASHRAVGRMSGSVGAWLLSRAFDARGEEALSPAVDQGGFAAFAYEEITWPHVTLQFGGRIDRTRYEPVGEPDRVFTNGSASAGVLLRPAAADDRLTIAASLARAVRAPALEEMFFFGEHHGNFAIEVGNPNLSSERALGLDLSVRWRAPRLAGELTYFRNGIRDYIFRREMDHDEFDARLDEFVSRFGGREPSGHAEHGDEGHDEEDHGEEEHEGEELAYVEFVGADALLQGIEAHADLQISARLSAEVGIDLVRGSLNAGGSLPRIPPVKFRGGLRYQYNALQAGGNLTVAAAQNRVSGVETPTDGYALLRLFGAYSFEGGGVLHTVTLRLDNATDTLYRNHLSLIKDVVPEVGRNFKALYSVRF